MGCMLYKPLASERGAVIGCVFVPLAAVEGAVLGCMLYVPLAS